MSEKVRQQIYLSGDLFKDLQRCAGVLERSLNGTVLVAIRRLINQERQNHPDAFPPPPKFTSHEALILEAIENYNWSLDDIVEYTGFKEPQAKKLLQNLQIKGAVEERKLSKTDAARGKIPRIYVLAGTPAGSDFISKPIKPAPLED